MEELSAAKSTVGWCFSTTEGTAVLEKPEPLILPKDKSPNKRGFLSCPAVRQSLSGVIVIRSSFSLHLKFQKVEDAVLLTPIYPFTSIAQGRLGDFIRLEPKESWRSQDVPSLQIPTPYLFVADEPIEMEQFSPSLIDTTNLNWRLIPGIFNIYGWQRPLNWAIEWDTKCGDLKIRQGEPLYFLRFYNSSLQRITDLDLINVEFTAELQERLNSTAGVTAYRRGLMPVMKRAAEERAKPLIVSKEK